MRARRSPTGRLRSAPLRTAGSCRPHSCGRQEAGEPPCIAVTALRSVGRSDAESEWTEPPTPLPGAGLPCRRRRRPQPSLFRAPPVNPCGIAPRERRGSRNEWPRQHPRDAPSGSACRAGGGSLVGAAQLPR
ncbi:unnamed protein product [Coccothraustes coccothraustes]